MVAAAASVEWIMASTEVDALMLEYNLIQEHRPAVQRPLPRRQVLSLPGADGGGALAARPGHAGRQAQERAVLRPLRARLRHPRDARRADPGLPGPDLLELVLRPARPGPPAVPVLRHRALLGAVRPRADGGHRGVVPRRRRGARRVPVGPRAPDHRAARTRDARRPPRRQEYELAAKLRDQLAAARRAHREPGDGALAARGPRRGRARRGRPGGGVPGVLRPPGPGDGPQGLGRGPGRGPRPAGPGRLVPARAVHGAAGRAAADPGPRAPGRRRRPGGVARRPGGTGRSGSRSPNAGPSAS